MTEQKIQLSNIKDGSTKSSKFFESDTILDLRKRFAEDQGIDFRKVTLYQAFLKLDDEKMVRDLINNVEGISFGITACLKVDLHGPVDAIWVIRNGKWNRLVKTPNGNFFNVGHRRHFLNNGKCPFAIVRSR